MDKQTNKFAINEIVRVKPDVRDPDFGTSIGAWRGKVEDITRRSDGSWLYGICWDNKTLGMADEKYISKCEKANLDYEKMYLDENSLELVTTTESKHDSVFLA